MNWTRLQRTAQAAVPAVTLADAKAHLRVDHDAEDALIAGLVEAATAMVEGPNGAGLALINQTWRLTLDTAWPGTIEIPLGPVQSVASIVYTDTDGQPQTLDPEHYKLLAHHQPAVIARAPGAVWPAVHRGLDAVTITFVAGFGAAATAIPADLRAALLLMVGHLYATREAAGPVRHETPLGYAAIVERYRCGRFGL